MHLFMGVGSEQRIPTHTDSEKPNVGLISTNGEIMT